MTSKWKLEKEQSALLQDLEEMEMLQNMGLKLEFSEETDAR